MSAAEEIQFEDVEGLRRTLEDVARTDNVEGLVQLVLKLLLNLSNENKRMAIRLQKALRSLHGRKSEKLSQGQLELFRQLLGDTSTKNSSAKDNGKEEDVGEGKPEVNGKERSGKHGDKKIKVRGHGRNKFPDELPRVDHLREVPDAERSCAVCGAEKSCIGHAIGERLDYVPAALRVVRERREKLACKSCQASVNIAPAAPRLIEGGLASEGLLAHVLVSKYVDGLPLCRLSKIYRRSGVKVAESTLGDWVRQTTLHLTALSQYIKHHVLSSFCIQQDDTGIAVLDTEHPNGIRRGHIYANVGGGFVFFNYAPNWRGEHPTAFLRGYSGIIQGDGYAGINSVFSEPGAKATRAGCLMHCRRYFFKAHQAGDVLAGIPLAFFSQLYEIEAEVRDRQLDAGQITKMRAKRSLPILTRLRAYIDDISERVLPKSEMGKAITYARNQWPYLLVPFSDGRMSIDNGEAERRLRPLAIGRRNWLFAGSDQGAERAATALTVLGSTVSQGVDPLAYLTSILSLIANDHPSSRIGELLPGPWAKKHGQQVAAQPSVGPRLVQ